MLFTVNKLLNVKAFYNKQFSHDDSGLVISENEAESHWEGRVEDVKVGLDNERVTLPDVLVYERERDREREIFTENKNT